MYKITKPVRLIELFAGIGSQAKALENLGVNFERYRVVEFDKFAIRSYNAVHGTNYETSDITLINADDLEIVDTDIYEYILTYSFPCQDLSIAGKQAGMSKGTGTRSGLLWEVERLLKECDELPQILLMENVPQVHNRRNMEDFNKWCKALENMGYNNFWNDLNAKDYGIPQNRKRCFMVSILNGEYNFPKPFTLDKRLIDLLECKDNKTLQPCIVSNCGRNVDHTCEIANTLMARDYKGFGNQSTNGIMVGDIVRRLTPRECWRLMGFSDIDFERAQEVNSNTQLYKQAGNSIVVNVLEEIFKQMF